MIEDLNTIKKEVRQLAAKDTSKRLIIVYPVLSTDEGRNRVRIYPTRADVLAAVERYRQKHPAATVFEYDADMAALCVGPGEILGYAFEV